MPYYEFWWDERTLEKLSINDVTLEEVEEVICYPERVEKSRSSGIPIAIGAARDGRLIACVYQPIDELTVKPVTAYYIEPR
ncbi:MAG: hypothetical protein SH850_12255 [Planctomycetaceae bacterium]|nr:hypothetical protein [Planctomycetaceae bacterium]